jgi:outer membrane receptor protein involved in Fe transport
VYEDGIYLATTTEGRNAYFDVERIDVLRGPQITAFGQHAYAGAVSIVSNKPNFDGISAYAEAENGLPDKTRWRLALNLPATDTLAFRFAGVSESRSGWINNDYIEPDSDDMNDRKVQSMRGSVLWQPSDSFSMLYLSRYQDENGTGTAPWGYQQVGGYVNGELLPGNQFAGPGAARDGGPWNVNRNFISSAQFENWLNTLDLNWDMGFARLQWLSNFTAFHGSQGYDNDYTNLGDAINSPFAGWKTSQTGWSSELRLTSEPGGSFNWLAGIFGSSRTADWYYLEAINGEMDRTSWDLNGDYTSDTVAAFGQATYDFTDRFGVTGGVRWNEQKKTYRNGADGKWDDVLWKLALEFDLSDRTMTYFSASTGYRPGGINLAPGVNLEWEPEKLTAWELGLKTQLADGRVRMNLAAFYNDFKDVQSQNFLVMPYPGSPEATEYTGNGGSADATGIEAEIQWRPTNMWNISTQLTWTDAKFGNYSAANLAGLGDIPGHTDGDLLHYDGWRPALTPEWVFGLQTSYTFQFDEYGSITPYLQTSYVSDYYASDINLAGIQQGSYSQTDLRVIWLAPKGNFQFQFYYINAEDEAVLNWARVYNPAARPDITTLQGNWGNPNTYGVIFNYTF